jgi:hypothetical protein
MPPLKTGKWAKAALNTTLAPALKAPKTPKMRAERGAAEKTVGVIVCVLVKDP